VRCRGEGSPENAERQLACILALMTRHARPDLSGSGWEAVKVLVCYVSRKKFSLVQRVRCSA
jgi:hypothetical protein